MKLPGKIVRYAFFLLLSVFYFFYFSSLLCLFVPPRIFWLSGLLTLLIPVFFLINVLLTSAFIAFKAKIKWIGLLFLLPGIFIIPTLYNFSSVNYNDSFIINQFKIISYNLSGHKHWKNKFINEQVTDWINGENPDIVCMQEYNPVKYIHYKNPNRPPARVKTDFSPDLEGVFPYHHMQIDRNMIGVSTFSKWPIVGKGLIFEGINKHNKGIYTDILVNTDTIRIINIHLESNTLHLTSLFKSMSNFWEALKTIKRNYAVRSKQINQLITIIEKSDKQVLLVGDFNETQFSNSYWSVRGLLESSFEEKGKGFGTTYLPGNLFLRIDHHFHSGEIITENIKTLEEVSFSDHVPLAGTYTVRKAASSSEE